MPVQLFAFLWLICAGAFVQRVAGPTYRGHALDLSSVEVAVFMSVLAGLWACVVVDYIILARQCRGWRQCRAELLGCLCPPLRIVSRSREHNGQVWFPFLGWHDVNRQLQRKLEKFFSIPMIVVALLILPVLIVEHFWGDSLKQHEHTWVLILLDSCTVVIWVAFATEFIVMCSVSDSKFAYCRSHWLDLMIILLPLVSFARALRLARLSRLARLGKISRAYRLRGLAIRAFRALLLVDIIARLIGRTPEKELQQLQRTLAVKEEELQELRAQIAALETRVAAKNAAPSAADPAPALNLSVATTDRT